MVFVENQEVFSKLRGIKKTKERSSLIRNLEREIRK
jgi:hypothetical protein